MSRTSRKIPSLPDTASAHGQELVVLVADDDPDWRMLVRDSLTGDPRLGRITVCEVQDGHEALQFLMREGRHSKAPTPALIYLDCEMPRLDGFALLRLMRQSGRLQNVAVIMLTGVSEETSMRRAFELGATGWIVKPESAADLKRALIASARHSLRLSGAQKRRAKQQPREAA